MGPEKAGADAGGLPEQGALGFTTAAGHPGTNPPPWSQEFTVELFRCLHLHIYIPDALKINFAL